jgi:hypothetical protein
LWGPEKDCLFRPVERCSGACTCRMRKLPGSSAAVAGSCLVAVRQLGSCLVVEPGRGARSSERWRAAGMPVTQCVGYGNQRVEAASCPVCWA